MPLLLQSGSYLLLQAGSSKLLLQADGGATEVNSSDTIALSEAVTGIFNSYAESSTIADSASNLSLTYVEAGGVTEGVGLILGYSESLLLGEGNSTSLGTTDLFLSVDSQQLGLSDNDVLTVVDVTTGIAISIIEVVGVTDTVVDIRLSYSDSGSGGDSGDVDQGGTDKSSTDTFFFAEAVSLSMMVTEGGSLTEVVVGVTFSTSDDLLAFENTFLTLSHVDAVTAVDTSTTALTYQDVGSTAEFIAVSLAAIDIYLVAETNVLGCTVTFSDGGLLTDVGAVQFPSSRIGVVVVGTTATGNVTVIGTTKTGVVTTVGTT